MRPHLFVLFLFLSASSAEQRVKTDEGEKCREEHPTLLHYFSWADYTVLAMMLLVSCLIGTFYGFFSKKQETSQDFLLGGSSMGTFPTAMSLAASFITAIELLGNPAEMYAQVRERRFDTIIIIWKYISILRLKFSLIFNQFFSFLNTRTFYVSACFYLFLATLNLTEL